MEGDRGDWPDRTDGDVGQQDRLTLREQIMAALNAPDLENPIHNLSHDKVPFYLEGYQI